MLVLLLAGILAACGGSAPETQQPTAAPEAAPTTAAATTTAGGTLSIGRTATPDSLNPGVAYLSEAFDVINLVYDALITTDLRNKAQPQLAKEWSVDSSGKVWTFKLHEGAKWHDGQPLTAEDVAFTFNMIKGFDAFALIKSYTSLLSKAEAPDATTAVLTFEQPVANTDERFSSVPILPKHIWEKFKDEKAATEFENLEMIGSGPFKLAEFKSGEFTRLTAVKDHYLTPPKIDEVIFKVYKNDDAMVQALKTGEVDLISPPNTVVRALQSEPNVKVEIGNSLSLTDIILNTTDPKNCPKDVGKCSGHPALRDPKVRQALSYATEKQLLIDTVLLGLGAPGLSLVMPGHGDGYAKDVQDYPFDVEKAKQILEEAGYKDTDGDGIREMPGDPSKPLSFRYSFASDQNAANGPRFFETLRDMWKQVGVEIKLQAMEADAMTAICCPAFDFDVINWGWGAGVDPSSLLYIATTDEIPTGNSETGYSNPEYDKLFKEQEVTVDKAKRNEILHQMQAILVRDVPYIIAYYAENVEAYRSDKFQGWVVDPEGVLSLGGRISLTVVTAVK